MSILPPEDADWEPLGEDVSTHTMMGLYTHPDGRNCSYHARLSSWTFDWPRDKRCLRAHDRPGLV